MENVTIVRSYRKNVGIQIESDASITVSIPYLYPKLLVPRILKDKEDWIIKKQKLVRARAKPKEQNTYYYLGKPYTLGYRPGQKELVEISDKLYVGSNSEKYIKTYLTSWYKQQARKTIVSRVEHYAKMSGSSYRSIGLTTAQTRWGSCSSEKSLNFNWKLVMAPLEVIDYVVVHELAHLTNLNHSRAFWETVRHMYPMYREYRTWLRRSGHLLTV